MSLKDNDNNNSLPWNDAWHTAGPYWCLVNDENTVKTCYKQSRRKESYCEMQALFWWPWEPEPHRAGGTGVSLQPALPSRAPWPPARREQTMHMERRKGPKLPQRLQCAPPRTSAYPGLVINKAQSISLEARVQSMRCLKEGLWCLHTCTVQLVTNSESSQGAGSLKGLRAHNKAGHTRDYPVLEDRALQMFQGDLE